MRAATFHVMHPMPTIRPMSTGLKVFSIPITTTAAESAPYRPTGKQAITTLWLPIRPSLYMLCDQTDLAPVFVHQAHRELLKESSRPKLPSPFSSSLLYTALRTVANYVLPSPRAPTDQSTTTGRMPRRARRTQLFLLRLSRSPILQ